MEGDARKQAGDTRTERFVDGRNSQRCDMGATTSNRKSVALQPHYTAASAYICQENTFLAYLTVLNGYGNNNFNTSQAVNPNSTIAYIQGTCSDGSVMPAFSYNFNSAMFQRYCTPLGYPSSYSYLWKNYNGLAMSTFAQGFSYRQGPSILCPSVLIQTFHKFELLCMNGMIPVPFYPMYASLFSSNPLRSSFYRSWSLLAKSCALSI